MKTQKMNLFHFARLAVIDLFQKRVITDYEAIRRLYNLGFRGKALDLRA